MTDLPPSAPPSSSTGDDVEEALAWAWRTFRANARPLVAAASVVLVVGAVLYALASLSMFLGPAALGLDANGTSSSTDPGFFPAFPLLYVVTVGSAVLVLFGLQGFLSNLVRMSLVLADGGSVRARDALTFRRGAAAWGTSALVALAAGLGFLLCYFPGPVVLVMSSFALFFVHDRSHRPVEAVRESVALVRSRPGACIVATILAAVLGTAGVIACGVGLVVSVPVALLFLTHRFRVLTGGSVTT